jgi:hypothetical protein
VNKEMRELFLIKKGDTMFFYRCDVFNSIAVINIIISACPVNYQMYGVIDCAARSEE